MALSGNSLNINVNATQAVNVVGQLNRSISRLNASFKDVNSTTQVLNKHGKAVSVTFRGMSTSGERFVSTLTNLKERYPAVTTSVDKFTTALSRAERQEGKLTQAQKTRDALNRQRQAALAALTRQQERANATNRSAADSLNRQRQAALALLAVQRQRAATSNRSAADSLNRQRQAALVALTRQQERANATNRAAADSLNRQRQAALALLAVQARQRVLTGRAAADSLDRQRVAAQTALRDQLHRSNLATIRLRRNLRGAGVDGAAAGRAILISWRSIGRLFVVQALHQSIALFRSAVQQAARESVDYQKSLSELRTITGDTKDSTEDWARALRSLGKSVPFKQLELTEAAYQALSNQIIKGVEDLGFLEAAASLAIVAVSDLDTSVGALSSVFNAFNISQLRTRQVSADLFETIVLGRTRLEQLGENLGRVSILSSRLGVSLREQQAALATLTIQGLKDNVAKTLLVNIFNKMIRPSERLKEIFHGWGVTSGEAAIAAFGLQGVMQRLFEISKRGGDSVAELGEIFQRVRATIGALGLETALFGTNFDKFAGNADRFTSKLDEISEEKAQKFKRAMTDLSNLMLDLGDNVTDIVVNLSETFNGLDRAIKSITKTVVQLGAAFVAARLARAILAIEISVGLLTTRLGFLVAASLFLQAAWVTIVSVGVAAFAYLAAKIVIDTLFWKEAVQQHVDDVIERFNKLNEVLTRQSEAILTKWLEKFDEAATGIKRSIAVVNTEIQQLINLLDVDIKRTFDNLSEAAENFGMAATDSLKDQIGVIKDALQETEKKLREVTNGIKADIKKLDKLRADVDEREARKAARGGAPQQLAAGLEGLGTLKGLEQARQIHLGIAKDRRKSDQERAVALQNAHRLEDKILTIKKAQIKATEAKIVLDQQEEIDLGNDIKKHEAQIAAREKALEDLKASSKKFLGFDPAGEFDEASESFGDLSAPQNRQAAVQTGQDIIDEFDRLAASFITDVKASGFDPNEVLKQEQRIADQRIALVRHANNVILQMDQDQLKAKLAIGEEELDVYSKRYQDNLHKARANAAEQSKIMLAATATVAGFADKKMPDETLHLSPVGGGSFKTVNEDTIKLKKSLSQIFDKEQEINALRAAGLNGPDSIRKLVELLKERKQLLHDILNLSQERIVNEKDLGTGQSGAEVVTAIRNATRALEKSVQEEADAMGNLAELKRNFDLLTEELKKQGLFRDPDAATKDNTGSLQELTRHMIDNIKELGLLRAELERRRIAAGLPAPAALGGVVRGPGGIDNVPAMLTHGEFVVNAKDAQANLGLLKSINRGGATISNGVLRMQGGGEIPEDLFKGMGWPHGSVTLPKIPFDDEVSRDIPSAAGLGDLFKDLFKDIKDHVTLPKIPEVSRDIPSAADLGDLFNDITGYVTLEEILECCHEANGLINQILNNAVSEASYQVLSNNQQGGILECCHEANGRLLQIFEILRLHQQDFIHINRLILEKIPQIPSTVKNPAAELSETFHSVRAIEKLNSKLQSILDTTISIANILSKMQETQTSMMLLFLEIGEFLTTPIPGPGETPGSIDPDFMANDGGYVHGPGGIDNVPAMLTRGEYVVNARAARANLPVLHAMNNSTRGSNQGDRVQNINIGDITVTGGNTSQATAREIAINIKREIKRGTLTL